MKPSQVWYSKYLESDHWQLTRQLVLLRGGKCEWCGKRGRDVHHLTYKSLWKEKPHQLTLLCADDHQKAEYGVISPKAKYPSRLTVYLSLAWYWLKEQYNERMNEIDFTLSEQQMKIVTASLRYTQKNIQPQWFAERAELDKTLKECEKILDKMRWAKLNDRRLYLEKKNIEPSRSH